MAGKTILNPILRGALLAAALLAALLIGPGSSRTPALAAGPFAVNDLGDEPDASVGNGVCATAGGPCTLRAALQEANANVDANTITFSVTGTITPATALPNLSSGNITIAGANQQVTIDGSGLPAATACLNLTSSANTIKGIVVAKCTGDGIDLKGANNTIGGTTASDRNVIRDGSQQGISSDGSAANGNQILGNYIGVNSAGNQLAQNNFGGVFLGGGATNNTIGGSSAGARNVIAGGNSGDAVRLMGAGPNNVVQGNYIGLMANGDSAIPNWMGVQIDDGASGNSVLNNVISGNSQAGVSIGSLFYSLSGSQTDLFGSINLDGVLRAQGQQSGWQTQQVNGSVSAWLFYGNKGDTLTVTVSALTDGCGSVGPIWLHYFGTGETEQITAGVADTCPGAGKPILTWLQPISIPASPPVAANNVVQGNKIGTNPAGSAAIPNGQGVVVTGATIGTLIGGPNSGNGNLISGNGNGAIDASGSEATVIQGNLIGTDAGGTYAIPNGGLGGVVATGLDTVIGGTTAGERNVISGNYIGAILVDAPDVNATIKGNYIGTNAAGNSAIASGGGITVLSGGNTIGGLEPGAKNLITNNWEAGLVLMWGGSQNNTVQGNDIVSNRSGVVIMEGASNNTIENNQISGNWGGPGVSIGGLWYTLTGSENVFGSLQLHGDVQVLVNGGQVDEYYQDGSQILVQSIVANPGDQLELRLFPASDGCGSVGPVWLQSYRTQEKVQLTPGVAQTCPGQGNQIADITYSIAFPTDLVTSSGNVVRGNKIGTNAAGSSASANNNGVSIIGNSSQNVIGGTTAGDRNIISGNNGDGVGVFGGSQDDVIEGNYIGLNASGTAAIPNHGSLNSGGIEVGNYPAPAASGTIIGGTTPGAGNVISGNDPAGIDVWGPASNVSIKGNYIGTNAAGNAAIGNVGQGIRMLFTGNNIVGGATAAERNVISGNGCAGIQGGGGGVSMWGANNNTVEGNYVGLSADGSKAIPNNCSGVDLFTGSGNNQVLGNVISGNGSNGVSVGAVDYSLAGSSSDFGTSIVLDDHIAVTRNGSSVYSGDAQNGTSANIFFGGYVGDSLVITVTSTDACASVGPVWLDLVPGGGSEQVTAGATNSCNGQPIVINHTIGMPTGFYASGNVIEDNRIGTNPAGSAALPNQGSGIEMEGSSSNTVIGSAGHGNVISGNQVEGISIWGASANDVIQGNLIGVSAAGNAALPNQQNGIYFGWPMAGHGTLIGGITGQGNVISANALNGVDLKYGAYDVVVQGNFIGTDATGSLALGNGNNGVVVHVDAHNSVVGGTTPNQPDQRNVIAFNDYAGVNVDGSTSVSNTIRGNSIYSNVLGGILLTAVGNTGLPAPVITALGPVRGTACANCTVDVYSDAANQGRNYYGVTTADGSGNFTFSGTVSGPFLTTTATDANGNTSQFSGSMGCAYDVAGDGKIDIRDVQLVFAHWPSPPRALDWRYDVDKDGGIDIRDVQLTFAHWPSPPRTYCQ
ncbi:MAG: right-handed parallel beta-helix repeat-containing protein [Dehalococcoidia bacterium]|jgi:parallel beta-helix repeat protein